MNILKLRHDTIKIFTDNGIDVIQSTVEVDLLIESLFNLNKKDLFICPEQEIQEEKLRNFYQTVDLRLNKRVPVQYLLGFAYFYGLKLFVNKDVLIPRSDTEVLVDVVIQRFKDQGPKTIADVGVGSGNISIALLKNCPNIRIIATDISEGAIEVARQNINTYNLANRITLYKTDILENINETVDAVVSNPPYIAKSEKDTLAQEIINYEPEKALIVTGENPLEYYEKLSAQALKLLLPEGLLAVEIAYNRADEVRSLFEKDGWLNVETYKDLNSLPRVVTGFCP